MVALIWLKIVAGHKAGLGQRDCKFEREWQIDGIDQVNHFTLIHRSIKHIRMGFKHTING